MARSVIWSQAASDDLDAAMTFIAETSPSFTSAFVEEVRDASRSLKILAERGRVVPEIGLEELREIFVRDHRMIYRVEHELVTILALFHGRRDFKKAWQERPR